MRRYKRVERVRDLLHQEVSLMLQRDIKDPRVQLVIITRVDLTEDLKYAKFYVTIPSITHTGGAVIPKEKKKEILGGLERARGYIRGELGKRLDLKYIPDIKFVFDEALEETHRVLQLLEEISSESKG